MAEGTGSSVAHRDEYEAALSTGASNQIVPLLRIRTGQLRAVAAATTCAMLMVDVEVHGGPPTMLYHWTTVVFSAAAFDRRFYLCRSTDVCID